MELLLPTERDDGRDRWGTPLPVYRKICHRWELYPTIDVCADKYNTKCEYFIDEELNALECDWYQICKSLGIAPIGWMNPPYSQPLMTRLIEKAIAESLKGFVTLFLLPDHIDRPWYHDLILDRFPHRPWKGRIPFDPPPPIKPSSPRYGNIHGVISK